MQSSGMPRKHRVFAAYFITATPSEASILTEQFSGCCYGVDVCRRFVAADAGDAWEAEGEAGGVAGAFADGVEGDFEDDEGFVWMFN